MFIVGWLHELVSFLHWCHVSVILFLSLYAYIVVLALEGTKSFSNSLRLPLSTPSALNGIGSALHGSYLVYSWIYPWQASY